MSGGLSPVLEDYLESILNLEANKKSVRLKDIAEGMAVRSPSALQALASLETQGLLRHKHYGGFELTSRGRRVAKKVDSRHRLLKDFLIILGVNEKTADADACAIEHYVSEETVRRMIKLVQENHRQKG